MEKVGFGGGCHWCTEAVFQSLRGVLKVDQGWISSTPPHDEDSEAVVVEYDSDEIDLKTLIAVHLLTHSSRSTHLLRSKYRSAIYALDDQTIEMANKKLDELNTGLDKKYVTQVLPLISFKRNQEKYLDYYTKNPEAPFCQNHIEPKLLRIRQEYATATKPLKDMRKVDMEMYSQNPSRFELRSGNTDDAPNCPYGNKYEWIGYDLETHEFVRFTKSVFKTLIELYRGAEEQTS